MCQRTVVPTRPGKSPPQPLPYLQDLVPLTMHLFDYQLVQHSAHAVYRQSHIFGILRQGQFVAVLLRVKVRAPRVSECVSESAWTVLLSRLARWAQLELTRQFLLELYTQNNKQCLTAESLNQGLRVCVDISIACRTALASQLWSRQEGDRERESARERYYLDDARRSVRGLCKGERFGCCGQTTYSAPLNNDGGGGDTDLLRSRLGRASTPPGTSYPPLPFVFILVLFTLRAGYGAIRGACCLKESPWYCMKI